MKDTKKINEKNTCSGDFARSNVNVQVTGKNTESLDDIDAEFSCFDFSF